MKPTLPILGLGLFMVMLSSCATYVDGGGYVGARPAYVRREVPPSHYYSGAYGGYRPVYYPARPVPPPAGVNARMNANLGLPLNVSSSTNLGIY